MGSGRAEYGKYPVLDLAGRYFFDQARHHIITLRIENLLGRQYATGLGTAERDEDGSLYTFSTRGVPRTLVARYTYKF